MSSERYPFGDIEPKWQRYWVDEKTFRADDISDKPKYYALDMFPYPSGSGLHVGHPEGYTATDIVSRYKRMCGYNVLHPMGWDAFGLPAEQYALKTGTHPSVTTQTNIKRFKEQIQGLGLAYDWDREVDTTDPDYYRWTQWIFLQLHKRGLAYESSVAVNWCPALGTVLANEEVKDGLSERGGHPVVRKPMRQWMLKITAYADRLLDDLDLLDWPESLKAMQRNWIGRSVGAEVDFAITGTESKVRVFTTRPDTLFGATYMVLAPEHELVASVTTADRRSEVDAYVAAAALKSDLDRTDLAKEKSGVFTGAYATNPVNDEQIPIWIADYVLANYGTGAIMAVPAHDERDHEFAKRFNLPIVAVVSTPEGEVPDVSEEAYAASGVSVNSGAFNGLETDVFKEKITAWLAERGLGDKAVNYRLRDWLFSRQRYWGEPFPVVHLEDGTSKPLPTSELPLRLPDVERYEPSGTGESPLATISDWVNTTDPESGLPARRETNTMPQWAGSCWYYLRYIDPKNDTVAFAKEKADYWLPVDLYIGGAEHAVLHLLYARFWHKVLYDIGLVSTPEPFKKLVNQGMILGSDGAKMSKSAGNVVNPEDIVADYGADALRLYEMFMGPLEAIKPWQTENIVGVSRFLDKIWKLGQRELSDAPMNDDTTRALHKAVAKVTDDIEELRFNTAISALMVLVNHLTKQQELPRVAFEWLLKCVNPFAPHIAEELWQRCGHTPSISHTDWPKADPALCVDDAVEMVVQVNGKVRARFNVAKGTDKATLESTALGLERVAKFTEGKTIRKVIVVPDRLVNIVAT